MSSLKATVEEVITNKKNKDFPVLLHFQNGDLKAEAGNMDLTFAQHKETGENHAIVSVSSSIYHGPVKDQLPADLVNTFVAVRNRKTAKIRLIQVKQATLQNAIYDDNQTESRNLMGDELSRKLLLKQFGGRRTLRSFEKSLRMNVSVDVLKDQLDKTVEASELPAEPEETLDEEHSPGIRPEFNQTAKSLEDVYSIYDIVSKDLMDRLNEEADAVLATNVDDLPITSELAKERIKDIKLSSEPRSNENLKTVKALIYLDALKNLLRMKEHSMVKSFSDITEKVENDIRKKFSQPGLSLKKTSYTRDKAFCHFIVLALLTSPNYEVDMNVLIQELAISKPKILKFANFVKAKPKAKSDMLTLALPESVKQIRPYKKRKRNN